MCQVESTKSVSKQLKKLSKKYQQRFFKVTEKLEVDPFVGKQLAGPLKGILAIRLWPYRILYSIDKKKKLVIVRAIKHRKEAY